MIERQVSAEFVNQVINHPSVYPWIHGPVEGPIDFTDQVESGKSICLFGEHGGFVFHLVSDGVYDAHSAVLPQGRGRWAIKAARASLDWMFNEGCALEVMMAVPQGNIAVRALVRILKAKFRGTIENGWWRDGHFIPSDIYSMTKADWESCRLQHH